MRDLRMMNRRDFMKAAGLLALWPYGCATHASTPAGTIVNDVHSQLNPTRVDHIVRVDSLEAIRTTILKAKREGKPISIAGGRHAMGGQQFGVDTVLIDTGQYKRVLSFDANRGLVDVEAGIQWPELIEYLLTVQQGRSRQWGIVQKQTGADRLSIGGALAANVHGRGLSLKPLIEDVESFVLVDADGNRRTCSRQENPELFRLAIGGYGLFGIIAAVKLRLAPRTKMKRIVEVIELKQLIPAVHRRTVEGSLYGDFQYSTDTDSTDFLWKGVFSYYRLVNAATSIPEGQKEFSVPDWNELIELAHGAKGEAFRRYADHYLFTSGQIYWSDTHQLSTYLDDYHRTLDRKLKAVHPATEIISEVYVPRPALVGFMKEVRDDFRKNNVNVIYGTIRLIERDDESFLAWAKQPYACIIFNLHTVHTPEGLEQSAAAFRRLIDMAIRRGGSYYLTYHKYATREQVLACYPQFPAFLRLKKRYDSEERFQSDWHRHYKGMFADVL
ncbi:MAG: FAD-binding oxidoreductase [Candidatus Methylomirabilales bacterium]